MSDQSLVPILSENPNQGPDGKFLPGNNANPTGENGMAGWQPYRVRMQKWLNMPVSEIRRIARSPSEVKNLSGIDAACLRHMVNMISGLDTRHEREALLDRMEGKPKNTTVLQNPDGGPLSPTMAILTPADGARAYQEMIQRTNGE